MTPEPEIPVIADVRAIEALNETSSTKKEVNLDVEMASTSRMDLETVNTKVESQDENVNNAQLECWGKYGRVILWIGIAIMWTAFEMDHTVLYNYQNYAASEFGQISSLGALQTAGTIIVAVMKPPIAKISDVAGRVETYIFIVLLYVISYVLCATAQSFEQYAGGFVIYSIGATGMQILNQIIVADITTSRWRGLANGLINLPFMIIPWISAFIVDSALNTIGWRWGIGMFAFIMPVVSLSIIIPLLLFRHRSKKAGDLQRPPTTAKSFIAAMDILGITLLTVGCAMFLLPMALAGNVSGGWANPWIPTVMVIGVIFLVVFGFFETCHAQNPVMPARYFRSASLIIACTIGLLDAFAFQVTHTYMYAWSTVSYNFSARNATFLTYTSGCFQVLAGLITGFLMFRSRRYKWLLIIGAAIRLIGYGVMMRLRGSNNSVVELFIVQAIQGLGSGTVGTVILVVAQIVVSKSELAQATALILLAIFMGQAIGSAVAGAIYTNLFKDRLRIHLGSSASQSTINNIFASIKADLPATGTTERSAINEGYSDILRYMTISALVASAIPFLIVWYLPNLQLSDKHNLSGETNSQTQTDDTELQEARRRRSNSEASTLVRVKQHLFRRRSSSISTAETQHPESSTANEHEKEKIATGS